MNGFTWTCDVRVVVVPELCAELGDAWPCAHARGWDGDGGTTCGCRRPAAAPDCWFDWKMDEGRRIGSILKGFYADFEEVFYEDFEGVLCGIAGVLCGLKAFLCGIEGAFCSDLKGFYVNKRFTWNWRWFLAILEEILCGFEGAV